MVARLSGYTDFRAGVAFHPATTFIAENCNQEKLYEVNVDRTSLNQFIQTLIIQVLDEVQCPQMVLTAGNDHQNEKPGGLAQKVWGYVELSKNLKSH